MKANFNYAGDPLNRLQSVSYDKTSAPTQANILNAALASYEYMTTGDVTRLKKVTDGAGTDELAYDPQARLCETKRTFTNRTAYPLQINYLFDALGRTTEMTYPAQWGVAGAPRKVETMTYDEASRVNGAAYDSKTLASSFVYNAASQTTALTVGHNAAGYSQWNESYTYEPATGLLNNQKVQLVGGATPVLDLSYEYLKQGTTVGRTGQLTKIVNNKDTSKNKYYDYDALGRLKTLYSFTGTANPMTSNQWTQTYGYDKFGNRTTVAKTGTITYTDGLASLNFTDGTGKVKTNRITTTGYTYDEAGNQTRGQTDNGVWQKYQYDAAGRLACTKSDADVMLSDYTYGASNHRLRQVEYGSGGAVCYYAWDGNSIISEFNDTGSALAWMKSYVMLGGRLIATQALSGTTFHHADRLGTRLITNAMGGTVAAEQTNLPYGMALASESWGTSSNQRFTSYDRSQKTGLDYAVNRFYSACQGRFTQVDPIGMSAVDFSDPQSLNLYAYVGGDPINRIDPDGLFSWKKFLGVVSKVAMWVSIAVAIAVAVLTIVPAAWAGTMLAKFAIWQMHHQILAALIGAYSPSFAITNLASTVGRVAFGTWAVAAAGAVNSFLVQDKSKKEKKKAPIVLPPPPGPYIYTGDLDADQPLAGNGQCVALVKELAGAPASSLWNKGDLVEGNTTIQRGTAVASGWDDKGRYPNKTTGNHAGFFAEFTEYIDKKGNVRKGFNIFDQWPKKGKATKRFVEFEGGTRDPSNNGSCFYIIK